MHLQHMRRCCLAWCQALSWTQQWRTRRCSRWRASSSLALSTWAAAWPGAELAPLMHWVCERIKLQALEPLPDMAAMAVHQHAFSKCSNTALTFRCCQAARRLTAGGSRHDCLHGAELVRCLSLSMC